jgi:DNA-binding NarL/FixJ family response regulator
MKLLQLTVDNDKAREESSDGWYGSAGYEGNAAIRYEKRLMTLTVKILIAEDFEPWRDFVATHLERNPDWRIVCEVSDGLEAIEKAKEFQPDLVVLDIGLPKLNGIKAASSIRMVAPECKIVFLSVDASSDIATAALNAGGQGYVVKSDGANQLLVAIETVLQGKQFVSSTLAGLDFSTTEPQFSDGSDRYLL